MMPIQSPLARSDTQPETNKAQSAIRRVSEWLAATLEMWCPARGCGFESRALRFSKPLHHNSFRAQRQDGSRCGEIAQSAISGDSVQQSATAGKCDGAIM